MGGGRGHGPVTVDDNVIRLRLRALSIGQLRSVQSAGRGNLRKCPDMTKRNVRGIEPHIKYGSQSKGKGRMERGNGKGETKV